VFNQLRAGAGWPTATWAQACLLHHSRGGAVPTVSSAPGADFAFEMDGDDETASLDSAPSWAQSLPDAFPVDWTMEVEYDVGAAV
jgi:hypothetical protein